MVNSYDEYYIEQAGSGFTPYQGLPYQRGHGFFGSLFSSIIKPLGRYFGKQALNTGVRLGSDVLSGENVMESLKRNLKKTGEKVLDDGYGRIKKFAQTGKGRRRRKRRRTKINMKNLKIKPRKKNKRRTKKKTKSVKKRSSKRKGGKNQNFINLFE